MDQSDFDLRALYDALDEQRRARQMSWAAVATAVNGLRTRRRAIAASTITGLKRNTAGEGDGILQMLLTAGQILRWDTHALFTALDEQRRKRQLTWTEVALEIRGFTPAMLTNLSKGGRIGFPRVMRLVRWLDQPAAVFTRIADW